jgi:hypothetical protein
VDNAIITAAKLSTGEGQRVIRATVKHNLAYLDARDVNWLLDHVEASWRWHAFWGHIGCAALLSVFNDTVRAAKGKARDPLDCWDFAARAWGMLLDDEDR